MDATQQTTAERVADVVKTFQIQQTGHAPKAVTVVLSNDTMVATLHEALSPAEIELSKTPEGAEKVQLYYRQLFQNSLPELMAEIQRCTGVVVREAVVQIDPLSGAVVHAFTSGTMVQVFLLAGNATHHP